MTRQVTAGLLATDVHAEVVDQEESATAGEELIDGVVRDYNATRGFGFIQLRDKRDAFFHISYVADRPDTVLNGTPVTCSLVQSERGLQAQNIRLQKVPPIPYRAADYLPQAMLARDSRKYDEAAALYEKGMRESPSVQLILSYAAMENNRRRKSDARRIYEAGIRLFPDIPKLRHCCPN
jgi:cold shock CspA family protein